MEASQTLIRPNCEQVAMIHLVIARVLIWIAQIYLLGRRWLAIGVAIFPFTILFSKLARKTDLHSDSLLIPLLGVSIMILLQCFAEKARSYILNSYSEVPRLAMIIGAGLSLASCLAVILSYSFAFGFLTGVILIPMIVLFSPLLPLLTRLSPQKAIHPDGDQINPTSVLLARALLEKVESLLHSLMISTSIKSAARKNDAPDLSDIASMLDSLWQVIDSLPENKLREITGKLTTLELSFKLTPPDQLNQLIRDLVLEINTLAFKNKLPEAMPHCRRPEDSPSLLSNFFVNLIYSYRSSFRPKSNRICAYYPSCSRYTELSLLRFGILKGSWIALQRMCRCHTMSRGGYDPVPGGE